MVVLFLGAGASAPFDYPVMDKLKIMLSERISEGSSADLLYTLSQLQRHDLDAETILQDIDTILSIPNQGLKKIFDTCYLYHIKDIGHNMVSTKFDELIDSAKILRELIHESIFEIYQFTKERSHKLTLYDQLFRILGEQEEHHIYTTNYDRIIEQFSADFLDFELIDGFTRNHKMRRDLWDPKSFDRSYEGKNKLIKLFKLHGSLDWKRSEYGIERSSHEVRGIPRTKDLLIYPASKEPPSDPPFDSLYKRFGAEISEAKEPWLVIGFSFRDPYLNRFFLDYIESGRQPLIVMSNDCENIATNLLRMKEKEELEPLITRKQIILIQCHFGEGDWNIHLKDVLEKL